jgi:hypothetical protein
VFANVLNTGKTFSSLDPMKDPDSKSNVSSSLCSGEYLVHVATDTSRLSKILSK